MSEPRRSTRNRAREDAAAAATPAETPEVKETKETLKDKNKGTAKDTHKETPGKSAKSLKRKRPSLAATKDATPATPDTLDADGAQQPAQPVLPIRVAEGQPLPTLSEPQPLDLSSQEYQDIQHSGVLSASLQRSRAIWVSGTNFRLFHAFFTPPKKVADRTEEDKQKIQRQKELVRNFPQVGEAQLVIEPHTFPIRLYGPREAARQVQKKAPTYGQWPNHNQQSPYQYNHPPAQFQPPPQQRPPPPPPKPQPKPQPPKVAPPPTQAPAPDPVIHMLAQRAGQDPELKAVMKIVAAGQATKEQLEFFQGHISELTSILQKQKEAGHHPIPPPPPKPVAAPSTPAPVQPPPVSAPVSTPVQPSAPPAPPAQQRQPSQSQQSHSQNVPSPSTPAPPTQQPIKHEAQQHHHQKPPPVPPHAHQPQMAPAPVTPAPVAPAPIAQAPMTPSPMVPAPLPPAAHPNNYNQPFTPQHHPQHPPTQHHYPQHPQQPHHHQQHHSQQHRPQQHHYQQHHYQQFPPVHQAPRVTYRPLVFDFKEGNGDKFYFPTYSFMEWLPNNSGAKFSFLITKMKPTPPSDKAAEPPSTPAPKATPAPPPPNVTNVSTPAPGPANISTPSSQQANVTMTPASGLPMNTTPMQSVTPYVPPPRIEDFDERKDIKDIEFYQPVTVLVMSGHPDILQTLPRAVRPQDVVESYMNEVFDKCRRAEETFLAFRLPKEGAEAEAEDRRARHDAAPAALTSADVLMGGMNGAFDRKKSSGRSRKSIAA